MAQELTEKPEEETEEIETGNIGNIFSPEGVMMLFLAVLLDIIGVICTILDFFYGVGEIPSWISDGVGIILIGGWMLFRSQTVTQTPGAKARAEKGLAKLFRGPWKRFLTPIIGEIIPAVGALPLWTLAVYYELTS